MSHRSFIPCCVGLGIVLFTVSSCTPGDSGGALSRGRYLVEVLEAGVDAGVLPDLHREDFDGDGRADRVQVTDTSLTVLMTGGGAFSYALGEAPWDTGTRLDDIAVIDLDGDGGYPSIVLATRDSDPDAWWALPARQLVIVNDSGALTAKRLWQYAVPAVAVDCARLESSALPVCFYGAYALKDMRWGVSGLIEIDVDGWRGLARDSTARAQARAQVARGEETFKRFAADPAWVAVQMEKWGWSEVGAQEVAIACCLARDAEAYARSLASAALSEATSTPDSVTSLVDAFLESSGPRGTVRRIWRGVLSAEESDSILAEWGVAADASGVEAHLALLGWFQERGDWLKAREVTQPHGLPWPAFWPPYLAGSLAEGLFISGVRFVDFSGDGLLDLVAVGAHAPIFSAVQGRDGKFYEATYHGIRDEYIGVWAPRTSPDAQVETPPCVYIVVEGSQSSRDGDYVECYDRARREWYEVELPRGPYYMDTEYTLGLHSSEGLPNTLRHAVRFWDHDGDGMIDFATRSRDGAWNVLTFTTIVDYR